eukprot:s1727_g10.t1
MPVSGLPPRIFLTLLHRHQAPTRHCDLEADGHESKRARTETAKKQRLDRSVLSLLQWRAWSVHGMPELWSDSLVDCHPPEPEECNKHTHFERAPHALLADVPYDGSGAAEKSCLGTVDVKDAFLMVDQPSPMLATLLGKTLTVHENLPGFLPKFANSYKIAILSLEGLILKRKIKRLESGLAFLPDTSAEHVIEMHEKSFGVATSQAIPCDSGIQVEDKSDALPPKYAFNYRNRSIVGACLYLARNQLDLLSTVKELSSAMTRPTYTALERLKKLVGYLKSTPDFCVLLEFPVGGQGRWHSTGLLESFSKVLWIQDAVRQGLVQLMQLPTAWNLSDIGAGALGVQRVRLLLHELEGGCDSDFSFGRRRHAFRFWSQFSSLREAHNELQGELEMLSDVQDQLHYGLFQMGGFTLLRNLTPEQRQHMYTLERGNMVASRTMGTARYMNVVRQQNQGVARDDDTDMVGDEENAESEAGTGHVELAEPVSYYAQVAEVFRNGLNECLRRHGYPHAAECQQIAMEMLDAQTSQPIAQAVGANMFARLETRADAMDQGDPQGQPAGGAQGHQPGMAEMALAAQAQASARLELARAFKEKITEKKDMFGDAGKVIRPPEVFAPVSQEDEIRPWQDWRLSFRSWPFFAQEDFKKDFNKQKGLTKPWTSST